MAADNPMSVKLPPLQWTSGGSGQERTAESSPKPKKRRRATDRKPAATGAEAKEREFEPEVPHKLDTVA